MGNIKYPYKKNHHVEGAKANNRIPYLLASQGTIVAINCHTCQAPFFFIWGSSRKKKVRCPNCNALHKLALKNGCVKIKNAPQKVPKCKRCESILPFDSGKSEMICECPKCHRRYYVLKKTSGFYIKTIGERGTLAEAIQI